MESTISRSPEIDEEQKLDKTNCFVTYSCEPNSFEAPKSTIALELFTFYYKMRSAEPNTIHFPSTDYINWTPAGVGEHMPNFTDVLVLALTPQSTDTEEEKKQSPEDSLSNLAQSQVMRKSINGLKQSQV